MAYALVSDLRRRWPGLPDTPEAEARAAALLDDAAVDLDAEKPPELNADGVVTDLAARRKISCAMVERAMKPDDTSQPGVTQQATTMGPFSKSFTFANPTGDLYLTKQERRLLGVLKQRAASIDLLTHLGETSP
jgi:hypothetical protein